jgi:4-carboxymuconolactone decarboxylase
MGRPVDQRCEELFRRMAINDEATVEAVLHTHLTEHHGSGLDAKTHALVRLAGLVALQASSSSYEWSVTAALAAGASDEEIVGVLVALAPVAGTARVSCAAVDVATAIGCELDLLDDG